MLITCVGFCLLRFSLKNFKGKILEVLKNWPEKNIQVIVVTDGERILGLGDLGCQCLPVTIDVGTKNETLLNDEFYMGLKQKRATGEEYDDLLHEFMTAVKKNYGEKVLIQFEDFANHNAFELLIKYRTSHLVFNDDIQTKMTVEESRKKIWLVDSKGLVVCSRKDSLQHFKQPWAHDHEPVTGLLEAVKAIKPTILIGTSGVGKQFTKEVIEAMSSINAGHAIFASGSPFDPVTYDGKEFVPGQANNAYIFPGFGLGLIMCGAIRVHDEFLLAAGKGNKCRKPRTSGI
ncbi:hypothetical protein L1987_06959 [Smallanthus sonchifolius]|uniref:Uncharacterized protein n=1 Tax=Smallanthus sonchifolius TaxID=185202 RepID=A0ACB9JZT2_9ASTR|nr:hypothetical protein L1987_06959 [Smallanthus sonchifolius]